LTEKDYAEVASENTGKFLSLNAPVPTLSDIGFQKTSLEYKAPTVDEQIIRKYDQQRDFPAINGTSALSVHLRFGTISIRSLVKLALNTNEVWLNELIWREFFMSILAHFPQVVHQAFKPKYDEIRWRNNEAEFERWCCGQTGYPIVDAGMRELNETGLMHNRVRMVVASFLTKHLLIDWRWGEVYFAQKLLDYDLSANNGNWQWAAGCGCDAAPYFRVFNPAEQTRKFDPKLEYIRRWVPELDSFDYPQPMVEHTFARQRALNTFKAALDENYVDG
jgi:deoxyribodipyrimidine photo-lyase